MDQPDDVSDPDLDLRSERALIYHQLLTDVTIIRAHAQIINRRARAGVAFDRDDVAERIRLIDAATDRLTAGLDHLRRNETP